MTPFEKGVIVPVFSNIYVAANCISFRLFDEATRAFKMQFNSQENIVYLSLNNASANTKGIYMRF